MFISKHRHRNLTTNLCLIAICENVAFVMSDNRNPRCQVGNATILKLLAAYSQGKQSKCRITEWWHFPIMFVMNCDISSGLLTIHHLCSIWLLLKVAHDWISLSVAVCLLIVWITKKIMQVWVYFETIFFIYTNKSDFILQIKLRNSIILEFANCPDCQFANLILSHHLPIHRIKMCQWKYVITSVCRIFWVTNWIKLVYILYECEKTHQLFFF